MALSFPLGLAVFQNTLKLNQVATLELREFYTESGTASGALLRTQLAAPKWAGGVGMPTMSRAQAQKTIGLLDTIGALGAFLWADPARAYPALDPDGAIVSGSAVTVQSIGGDGASLAIAGLPADYALSAGDLVSIEHNGQHALHQLVADVSASGAGVTPEFEVRPHVKAWSGAGQTVHVERPRALMKLTGVQRGAMDLDRLWRGLGFEMIEGGA